MTDVFPEQFWLFDNYLTMFQFGIGGPDLGWNDGRYQGILAILMILVVFIGNVTMLNMLIAIMGDIFEETTENRKKYMRIT